MLTNILSALILNALFFGRSYRRNPKRHAWIMTFVLLSDLSLIIYLVMGRNVFSKLHAGMASLLILHICLALGAVVSYIFAAYVGFKLYRGDESFRGHMRLADRVIVPLRVLVLITSLLLVFLR